MRTSFDPTVGGEATAVWGNNSIGRVKVTRTGMGTPVGSDIEYFDEISMLRAMEGSGDM